MTSTERPNCVCIINEHFQLTPTQPQNSLYNKNPLDHETNCKWERIVKRRPAVMIMPKSTRRYLGPLSARTPLAPEGHVHSVMQKHTEVTSRKRAFLLLTMEARKRCQKYITENHLSLSIFKWFELQMSILIFSQEVQPKLTFRN